MSSRQETEDLWDDPILGAFVDEVRAYAAGPPPTPRPELATLLARGTGAGAQPRVADTTRSPQAAPQADGGLAGLRDRLQGRRARWALGGAVLSLAFLGTGAAGALPAPAQAAFQRTAEVIGVELPAEVRGDDVREEELRRRDEPRSEEPEAPAEAPAEPADGRDGEDGGDAPEQPGGREGVDPPVDDAEGAPSTRPPAAGDGGRRQDGAPGNDLSRDARDELPMRPPAPGSPPTPAPPEVLPGDLPEGIPSEGWPQGNGDEEDRDNSGEEDQGAEQERRPPLPASPSNLPTQARATAR